jgi:hypothetical protein
MRAAGLISISVTLIGGLLASGACSSSQEDLPAGQCVGRVDPSTSVSISCAGGNECSAPPVNTFYATCRKGPETRNCGPISCAAPHCTCVNNETGVCACNFY